jgi:hypothetical protein
MRVYTVHEPPASSGAAGPVLVREGFSWAALLFGPLWALAHRLWLEALAWFLLVLLAGLLSPWFGPWAAIGLQFLLAAEARNLRRWALRRRGWTEAAVVAAPTEPLATQRLLDAVPA